MALELENKHYSSPRWSWEILDCAMPMTFDTYSNCAHQCVYCFAFFQRAIGPHDRAEAYLHHKVASVNVDKVKRLFTDPDNLTGNAKQFAWYIRNRYVLQWGGLSDGFDWYERKFRKSLELLKFFVEIDYPISISTKGVWFLDDPEYVAVLQGAKNVHFKYSIITLDEQEAQHLEAGTPTPDERYRALEKLNRLGIGATTLRFRPFVLGVSDRHIEPMFQRAKDAGCYSITTEFLCLEKRASGNHHERYRRISDVCGFNVWDYYRQNSYSGGGLMRLNYEVKRPYIRRMEALAEELDIPFFVSDAHHKEASAGAGCCGLPSTGPLSNYNRGQFSEAIQVAKANGFVRWADIAPHAEGLKNIPFFRAAHFNQGSSRQRAERAYHSMFDYMRDMWNSPRSWSSPARYFGGALVPGDVDDDGDIIYLYNRPFIEDGIRVESVGQLQSIVAQQMQRRVDGGDLGHVAYPVFVDADKGEAAMKLLVAARLQFTALTQNGADYEAYGCDVLQHSHPDAKTAVIDFLRGYGMERAWLLSGGVSELAWGGEPQSVRAALSAAEGALVDGAEVELSGAELVVI